MSDTIHTTLVSKIKESNTKYPHPEKERALKFSNIHNNDILGEKLEKYRLFYDRNPKDILELSDDHIVTDLQERLYKFAEIQPDVLYVAHMTAKLYLQPFLYMAEDYNISWILDSCQRGALIPRNFHQIISILRNLYKTLTKEVEDSLERIEYFTKDLQVIVISYMI